MWEEVNQVLGQNADVHENIEDLRGIMGADNIAAPAADPTYRPLPAKVDARLVYVDV